MQDSDYVAVCFCCGHAMTKYEIGGELRGQFVDYGENAVGELSVVVCGDCWRKAKEIQDRGVEYAILVRNKLAEQDRQDRDRRGDPLAP